MTFEITETAACEQLNNAIEFIQKVRQLGCQISLDDFGVGFSSFSYLKHLRADILKIDGSFVRNIEADRDNQFFIQSLADTLHSIDIRVYAQAVETRSERETLESLGIDGIQGYLSGRPELLRQE